MLKAHISNYIDLYLILMSWGFVGAIAPSIVAVAYSVVTFLLIMRTAYLPKVLISVLAILLMSDSRSSIFDFAETAKIFIVACTGVYVLLGRPMGKSLGTSRIFLNFLPFIGYALVTCFFSDIPITAFQKTISYSLILFSIPSLTLGASKQDDNFPMDLLIFFGLFLLFGLLIYLVNPQFTTLAGRYRGLLGNPNGLGIFLTLIFALVFILKDFVKSRGFPKSMVYAFLIVFLLSLVLSGSRTSLVAVVIFFGYSRIQRISNVLAVGSFLVLIIGYEYFLTQLPAVVDYFGLSEYLRLDTLKEGSGRFIAWDFAWRNIQDVFFIGGGYGYTETIYFQNYSELSLMGHQGNAHNSYLTLWLDTGLFGVIAYMAGLIATIVDYSKYSILTLPITFAILFSSFFESWLSASLNPFTSLFFMSLAFLSISETKSSLAN
jgi:hypothetical protein